MTNLPAGAELDRLVAEKVMGWFATKQTGLYWMGKDGSDPGHEVDSWMPSTRIDHAWEVVEKMRAMTGNSVMVMYDQDSTHCEVETSTNGGSDTIGEYAETAPLAICLTAIKLAAIKAESAL